MQHLWCHTPKQTSVSYSVTLTEQYESNLPRNTKLRLKLAAGEPNEFPVLFSFHCSFVKPLSGCHWGRCMLRNSISILSHVDFCFDLVQRPHQSVALNKLHMSSVEALSIKWWHTHSVLSSFSLPFSLYLSHINELTEGFECFICWVLGWRKWRGGVKVKVRTVAKHAA